MEDDGCPWQETWNFQPRLIFRPFACSVHLAPCVVTGADALEGVLRRPIQDHNEGWRYRVWGTVVTANIRGDGRGGGGRCQQVVWASSLPEGTSAQKAELIALTQTLQRLKDDPSTSTPIQRTPMLLLQLISMVPYIDKGGY